jgi:uncharacterized membrane protein
MLRNGHGEPAWSDQKVEEIMGNLLRGGVMVAALVVSIGGLLYLARYGAVSTAYQVFLGEPADLRTLSGIMTDALALRSRGLMQLGLLLLVATPVARVAFAAFAFAWQHDRIYVTVSLIVLALLVYSLFGWRP